MLQHTAVNKGTLELLKSLMSQENEMDPILLTPISGEDVKLIIRLKSAEYNTL
jgi:hypothetical protein